MVLVVKGDQHATRVYPLVADVGDHAAVKHPRPWIGAGYLHIRCLSRSDVLGIDHKRSRLRIPIERYYLELVTLNW